MEPKNYPVAYYLGGDFYKYAHNKKDEETFAREGATEQYAYQEFPKALYDKNGNVERVLNQAQEAMLVAQGFSTHVVPKKETMNTVIGPAASRTERMARLEQLEELNAQQAEQIAELKAVVADIVAAQSKRKTS